MGWVYLESVGLCEHCGLLHTGHTVRATCRPPERHIHCWVQVLYRHTELVTSHRISETNGQPLQGTKVLHVTCGPCVLTPIMKGTGTLPGQRYLFAADAGTMHDCKTCAFSH